MFVFKFNAPGLWQRKPGVLLSTLACLGLLCLGLAGGCHGPVNSSPSSSPKRDINAVLADHQQELLALPDVVGVYVGLMQDEKTVCLKVMLAKRNAATEQRMPRTLEGYPVVTEVTGEIRPMGGK